MQIKPKCNSNEPEYPTLITYVENPGLLSKSVPKIWLKNKIVVSALTAFIMFGSSDHSSDLHAEKFMAVEKVEEDRDSNDFEIKQKEAVKVAPIFAHGEGSGADGCIVISPPVFIPEDEAMELIISECAKHGINFKTEDCPEIEFKTSVIKWGRLNDIEFDRHVKLRMDGYDKEKNLAFQFISKNDSKRISDDESSPFESFNPKKSAISTRNAIAENKSMNAVVFYDPLNEPRSDKNFFEVLFNLESDVEDLLLDQVNDFIEWYKKEFVEGK
jgi:hypothetical protein